MPIYVYRCADCSEQTEKRQGFADAPLTTCATCGGSLRRVVHPVGVIFKGSGFYSTDYRNGSNGAAADGKNGNGTSESSSGDGKKAEASGARADGAAKATGSGDAGSASTSGAAPAASGAKSD